MRRIIEPMLKNFDLIYTYDEKEAKLFGFSYYPTVYSMVDVGDVEMIKRKCFFVGLQRSAGKLIRIMINWNLWM